MQFGVWKASTFELGLIFLDDIKIFKKLLTPVLKDIRAF